MKAKPELQPFEYCVATLSLLLVFAASAAPIPLYDVYHRDFGVTYNALALTSVFYFVGAVSALIFLGRISNHLGRKPLALLVFSMAAISCLIFIYLHGAIALISGRLLLGLACGLASSGITAYIADAAPEKPEWVSATTISITPLIGLTLGAVSSGVLVEYAPYPLTLCYVVVMTGLTLCALLLFFSEDTVTAEPGLIASFKPQFTLPEQNKPFYPVAALTFVATWALGGFLQAYGPSIAAAQLGTLNVLTASVVFASFLLPGALGGPLTARLTAAQAQRLGMVIFALAVVSLVIAMSQSSVLGLIAASAIAGIAQGAVLTGSVRSLMRGVPRRERAGVLSLIFATSYTGAAIPTLITGQLSAYFSLLELAIFYAALASAVCVVTLIFAREPVSTQDTNTGAVTVAEEMT